MYWLVTTNGAATGKMTKKRKLSLEYVPEFTAIGIFTPRKDYRFCWLLNQNLNLDFKRLPDFWQIPYNQAESVPFPIYFDDTPSLLLQYFLIVNKTPAGILFDKPKNLDLLFLLKNGGGQADPEEITGSIKRISMVQAAYLLDDKLGKRAANIFYDLEMHMANVFKNP